MDYFPFKVLNTICCIYFREEIKNWVKKFIIIKGLKKQNCII